MIWPNNKKFAFTIIDDTDQSTLYNVKPIYDFLSKIGMRTTKSVWSLNSPQYKISSINDFGETCEDDKYLDWLKDLQKKGFEIALHNVKALNSNRAEILKGFKHFYNCFGFYPNHFVNHNSNIENIYWGIDRVSGIRKYIYFIAKLYSNLKDFKLKEGFYKGHKNKSKYFWGDISKKHVKYVRNFVFNDINTLKFDNIMPYHDSKKEYVNNWYSASNGGGLLSFNKLISKNNVDKLIDENGLCIVYTHFGKGFFEKNSINSEWKEKMEYISSKDGWFVPVNEVLNHLDKNRKINYKRSDIINLENKWIKQKIKYGGY